MESKIEKILDEQVRPMLAFHRGSVDFVSYEEGVVKVRLQGTCKGCPLSALTLKAGIESVLKEAVPDIKEVEAVE